MSFVVKFCYFQKRLIVVQKGKKKSKKENLETFGIFHCFRCHFEALFVGTVDNPPHLKSLLRLDLSRHGIKVLQEVSNS